MELFETNDDYIILDGEFSLWCNRDTGKLTPKFGWEIATAWNPSCLGKVYGIIGKVKIGDVNKLLLVNKRSSIGFLYGGHEVYSINRIAVLPLSRSASPDLGLDRCEKHHVEIRSALSPETQAKVPHLQKTWNSFKTATTAQMKTATAQVKTAAGQVAGKKTNKDFKDKEKFDKRVTEELIKMFSDTDSFYFSPTGDLTNSVQRHCIQQNDPDVTNKPLWQRVDDRFFWNKHMLQELIDAEEKEKVHWIVPIIQGFVDIENCHIDSYNAICETPSNFTNHVIPKLNSVGISLISRRCRYRAGTRYRRRGVDELGRVANYVETEQIVEFNGHVLSFVQTRGSVPIYWSQPGYKYRPPPRLDRSEDESNVAFQAHFEEELSVYKTVAAINLIDKTGREKILSDAYLNHILNLNHPSVTYVSFDFHQYCRGMAFENVNVLIMSIEDIIKEMGYCWRDKDGMVCEQNGVFRVNCVDCLDRTNVVQTALGKYVIEIQFSKLGVIPPEKSIPHSIRTSLQTMWANNGDSLSRQYAGTAALKGDFTRTGERGLTGVMKDSYTSANRYYVNLFRDNTRQTSINLMLGVEPTVEDEAEELIEKLKPSENFISDTLFTSPSNIVDFSNDIPFGLEIQLAWATTMYYRYYLNRFKDAYRQVTIDLLLGNPIMEDDMRRSPERESADNDPFWSEHIKQLLEDCKKLLVSDDELIIGAWAVIDADPDTGDPSEQDADVVLILTKDLYYVAEYDGNADRITRYQRVMLKDLEKIELGQSPSLFKSKHYAVRLNYIINGQSESLKAICETYMVALDMLDVKIPFYQGKLDRRRSKTSYNTARTSLFSSMNLELPSLANLPRNVSEGQLLALKNAGSKAISNVTSFLPAKLAKLNPLKGSLVKKDANETKETGARAKFHMASSDSDEENISFDIPKNDTDDDFVLDSCGIVASLSKLDGNFTTESSIAQLPDKTIDKTDLYLDIGQQNLPVMSGMILEERKIISRPLTPEIFVSKDDEENKTDEERADINLIRKLSHSSEAIEKRSEIGAEGGLTAATSATSIKTSHSEGAIREIPEVSQIVLSPSAISKDLVLGSLSKITKGVQSLGMNIQRVTSDYSRVPFEISSEKYTFENFNSHISIFLETL
ncbi:hypothetical protein CHUAL_013799 [Chamberlinius hualienensis]